MGEIQFPYAKLNVVATTPLHHDLFNKPDNQVEGLTERIGGTWTDATRPVPTEGVPHPIGWNLDRECYEYFDGLIWRNLGYGSGSSPQVVSLVFGCDPSISVRDWVAIASDNDKVVLAAADSIDTAAVGVVNVKINSTTARVLMHGELSGFSGLSPRDLIFLSTTPGEHVVNPSFDPIPSEYKVVQRLGIVKNATTVVIAPGLVVEIESEP